MIEFLIFTVVAFAAIIMNAKSQEYFATGGLGASNPVDPEITEIIDRQKVNILKKVCDISSSSCPSSDARIVVNSYRRHLVAGVNNFVILTIDDIVYHAKIFVQPWTQTEEVQAVQGPKKVTDELQYFY